MKDVLLSFPDFKKNILFQEDMNGFNKPWKFLKEKLFEIGYNLKTVDQNDLSNCAWIIFVNKESLGKKTENGLLSSLSFWKSLFYSKKDKIPERNIYDECVKLNLQKKMILLLWEGDSVIPNNYKQELYDKFSTIFTWKDDLVDNKKFFKFYLPYPNKKPKMYLSNFNKKKILVNISMNKYSNTPNELYSMRKKSIKFFEKTLGDQFDLFGFNWNKAITIQEKMFPFLVTIYKSYRGVTQNKIDTLSQYKFALCYENLEKTKGYVTEKIFDCFNAKTVPIYWGAENITDYVSEECFIDRRKFSTNKQLLEFLNKIEEKKYNQYIDAIEKYLQSEKYKLFLMENFAKIIIDKIK